jgi:AraC-like DNA-binding protein
VKRERPDAECRHRWQISGVTTAHPSFTFTTHPFDRRLRPWFRSAWEFAVADGAPSTHHVPPDGLAFLVLVERGPFGPLLLGYGPQIEPLVIPTSPGSRYRGLRFAAESASLLTGESVDALLRGPIALSRLGPVPAAHVAVALRSGPPEKVVKAAEALFLPVIDQLPPPDAFVAAALDLIHESQGRAAIADIAATLRLAPRTLLRRVRSATGLTPKQHARIARFFAAAQGMLDPDHRLSDVAARGGYADQPHFHHEVSALTGLTPAELSERVRRTRHHFAG